MKKGEKVSETKIRMLWRASEIETGTVRLNHPRCGKVVIRKVGKVWKVSEIERPDKEQR
jgi:hypothetical protein